MTVLEATKVVLEKARRPLSGKEIFAAIMSAGLWQPGGKTPVATIVARIYMNLQKPQSCFVKVAKGMFGLKVWNIEAAVTPAVKSKERKSPVPAKSSEKRKGVVYILCDDHCRNCVKIGRTSGELAKRLRSLQTGNPWIRPYATLETSRFEDVEKFLHDVIKLISRGKQVGNSEFYRFSPEDAKTILLQFRRLLPADDFQFREYRDSVSRARAGKSKPTQSVQASEPLHGETWKNVTQLAKLIARRGGNEGAFGGILHFFNRKRPCVKSSKWRAALEAAGVKFDANDFVKEWSCARNPL